VCRFKDILFLIHSKVLSAICLLHCHCQVMALLRLVCLTSTNQLSTQSTSFSFLRKTPHSQSIHIDPSSFHFPRLSLITTTLTHAQQANPVVAEEEFSRTRLLAQNVPWTSTPEDIRSLFEKHGKVLQVEVCFFPLFFSVLFI